ncbi:Protein BONZAI 3 [Morus notabilis]|uniref:Protein BONZAI 3 n=1 Tax=Morus notabilis TaxID=981085 RepID=W9R4C5_9ROSA|nr:Protein BONZAI 3 [Morus notabilis]
MGGCFSDMKGGKQGIGGAEQRPTAMVANSSYGEGPNDAVEFFHRTRGQHPLFTQLELSLSASNLLDCDITSKSDPMAVVFAKKVDGKLEELGRTEVILNSLNPAWINKVAVSYQFETVKRLIFHVYDVDTKYHNIPVKMLNLKDQDFLGEATCVLSEIVTVQSRSLTVNLSNNNGRRGARNLGTLTIHAEETVASRSLVEIKFRCSNLENMDLFSKSDPFLRVSRIVETGGSIPICKTEVVDNDLNPTWKPLCLSMQQKKKIAWNEFEVDLFRKLQKSVAELERLHKERTGANFLLPSSKNGHEKVLKGQLFVDQFQEKLQFSFLDYISSGFELNFMVAVDFTASNGNPQDPTSLHHISPYGRLNSYQQAIMQVGEVIQFYDSDRRFPAWGFGGRKPDGTISHCFNLSANESAFEVEGVEGIMDAYARALHKVSLAGPTLFGQVIDRAAQIAGESLSHHSNKYYVLLIITDGVLTNFQETKDALVKASNLPLSVLIVGVGGADFTEMEILDADNGCRLESSTGRVATRDIVQFVPMRDVHSGQISAVQALLEELPGQFLTYVRSRDIKPSNLSAAQTSV